MVIEVVMGKNSKYLLGSEVASILVDTGTSVDIITYKCFTNMGFTDKELRPADKPLFGFGGKKVNTVGTITMNLTFEEDTLARTEFIPFDVADVSYPYNAIFGRGIMNKFAAVIHQGYLCMKIPTFCGALSIYNDQEEA